MTPEGKVTVRITAYLKSLQAEGNPVWWFKVHGHSQQMAGVPDLCIVWHGHAVFLEVKAPAGGATRLQEHRCQEIRRAGGTATVVRSVAEVVEIFASLEPNRWAKNDGPRPRPTYGRLTRQTAGRTPATP